MKKVFKVILIVVLCLVALGVIIGLVAHFATGKATDTEEYVIGDDSVKSIKTVVGERKANGVGTGVENGVTTKRYQYESDTVQDDLITYTQYLLNEAGFILTQDMDLTVAPSTVQCAKQSVEEGQVIVMTIEYDLNGYTIIMQKGTGTLTANDAA